MICNVTARTQTGLMAYQGIFPSTTAAALDAIKRFGYGVSVKATAVKTNGAEQ